MHGVEEYIRNHTRDGTRGAGYATFYGLALQIGVYHRAPRGQISRIVGVRKSLKGWEIRSLFKTLWFDIRHSSQRPFLPPKRARRETNCKPVA